MTLPTELVSSPCDPAKVLDAEPTLIGVVNGIRFFEHPTKGDTAPLIMVSADGSEAAHSTCYELPYFEHGAWYV